MWAEAVVAFRNEEDWWLTEEEDARLTEDQAQYVSEDPWEALITTYVEGDYTIPVNGRDTKAPTVNSATSSELLIKAIGKEGKHQSRADEMKVGVLMGKLGWKHARETAGRREWKWYRPGSESKRAGQVAE